jgi:arginyl-tRNA synthetase
VITGELSAAVAAAADAARAAGELAGPPLPGGAMALAGSWRPVPATAGGGPGSYATTIPFLLASRSAGDPAHIAAVLAARLADDGTAAGICRASVTGPGYLSLTVSPEALGRLAAWISQAGAACARSDALRGTTVTAPAGIVLADAGGWDEAWQRLAAELAGRLAGAAGAEVTWTDPPEAPAPSKPSVVAAAVTFAGLDAIRYALSRAVPSRAVPSRAAPSRAAPSRAAPSRAAPSRAVPSRAVPSRAVPSRAVPSRAVPSGAGLGSHIRAIDPRGAAAQHLGNPFYAVRYAHAHAASILRQSADLGLPAADVAQFQPRLLAHPREQTLLDALSWLPERVAGAARRGQPHGLAAYLEDLTGRYLDWHESCPLSQPGAFPPEPDRPPWPDRPRGPDQPPGSDQPLRQARLVLADATRTVLGTGLGLLGVAAPGGV